MAKQPSHTADAELIVYKILPDAISVFRTSFHLTRCLRLTHAASAAHAKGPGLLGLHSIVASIAARA